MVERAFVKGRFIEGKMADKMFKQDIVGQNTEVQADGSGRFRISMSGGAIATALFLPYRLNAINYVLPQGQTVLSSKFTGCRMVKYSVPGGETRIAHVATPDCNALWDTIKNTAGVTVHVDFKPNDVLSDKLFGEFSDQIGKFKGAGEILAAITPNNEGYVFLAVAAQISEFEKSGAEGVRYQIFETIKVT